MKIVIAQEQLSKKKHLRSFKLNLFSNVLLGLTFGHVPLYGESLGRAPPRMPNKFNEKI